MIHHTDRRNHKKYKRNVHGSESFSCGRYGTCHEKGCRRRKSELEKILLQLQENLKIAGEEMIPICQDTGMAVFL